ncbi:MAG: PD-(D/E)XK nuclease family protein [Candidatus Liptonbacteria bacterium]|nr:PD-(D/E)XK nuclease family protein [Candidatus Liptonbacteria bacterium]
MNQIYAYREPPPKLSASTMQSFVNCEMQCAYERLLVDPPSILEPLPRVFGNVIHSLHELLWKNPAERADGVVRRGMGILSGVLKGAHGLKGEKSPPVLIRFLTRRQITGLTESEVEERTKEEKEKYMAKGRLMLQALRLERIAPVPNLDLVEVERDLGKDGIEIQEHHAWRAYRLSGRMDRIFHYADGSYEIFDVKTGKVDERYARLVLLHNIQMTLYHRAGFSLFGRDPIRMWLIALRDVSKSTLARAQEELSSGRSPDALREMYVEVPLRKPVDFTDLAQLAADIDTVMRMVIFPHRYRPWQIEAWEPLSAIGKKADFKDNVREGRFMPRIGAWCETCTFLEACREDNASDWEKHYRTRAVPAGNETPPPAAPHVPPDEPQVALFETFARPKSLRKSDREHKRKLRELGFLPRKSLLALYKRAPQLIPAFRNIPCACRELDVFHPEMIARLLISFLKGTPPILEVVRQHCPYEECPFRETRAEAVQQ